MEKIYTPLENKNDLLEISKTMELTEDSLTKCLHQSLDARNKSYSIYSKFRVGAALITKQGVIYQGCNVENLSYGLSICAERNAICSSICLGERHENLHAVFVSSDREEFVSPCGACRQFIVEFPNIKWVVFITTSGKVKVLTAESLLPHMFKVIL